MELTWFVHLFFFVIGVVFPTMAIMTEKPGNEEDMDMSYLPPKKHIYYTNGLMLLIGSLMVLTLWNVTYRSFEKLWASIGASCALSPNSVGALVRRILQCAH